MPTKNNRPTKATSNPSYKRTPDMDERTSGVGGSVVKPNAKMKPKGKGC